MSERCESKEFKVGDLVSRDGTDVQRVLDTNDYDQILVECIVEPLGMIQDDGSRGDPWCRVGEQEWNLARRYVHTRDLIIEGTLTPSNRLNPPEGE